MPNNKTEKDNKILAEYAKSVAVDRETLNLGSAQLDIAMVHSEQLDSYLDKKNSLKKELLETLSEIKANGKTPELMARVLKIQKEIKTLEIPNATQFEQVKTQEIVHSFDEMKASNEEFAKKYDLDLSNPFAAAFTNYEREVISHELAEKFDLLRLDKYDYAFATVVGLIGGIVDAVFIGTASKDGSKMGKLAQLNDKAFDKVVQGYAKLSGWQGSKEGSDPTKSAIAFLERQNQVNYDQRYAKDILKHTKDNGKEILRNMNPSNHHLTSLSHSLSVLGLIFGIMDLLQGKATFYDDSIGEIIRVSTPNTSGANEVNSIIDAITRWFGHIMSDIAGGSGSVGRGTGVPTGLQTVLQSFQFGKIPIKEDGNQVVYATIGDTVKKMFENGYDFRFSVATAIPVIICEVLVRLYWFCKQHFYYGKPIKESVPFGKDRELQRLLLLSSLAFSTVDVAHAIIKGYAEQNPITVLNSLNYVALMNLGYKLFVNFKLEHEHNEKVRELMRTEIKQKHEQLINSNFLF